MRLVSGPVVVSVPGRLGWALLPLPATALDQGPGAVSAGNTVSGELWALFTSWNIPESCGMRSGQRQESSPDSSYEYVSELSLVRTDAQRFRGEWRVAHSPSKTRSNACYCDSVYELAEAVGGRKTHLNCPEVLTHPGQLVGVRGRPISIQELIGEECRARGSERCFAHWEPGWLSCSAGQCLLLSLPWNEGVTLGSFCPPSVFCSFPSHGSKHRVSRGTAGVPISALPRGLGQVM